MTFFQTSTLTPSQKTGIITLWNQESPEALTHSSMGSLNIYLNSLVDVVFTLVLQEEQVIGWFADFERDDERWFAMLLDNSIHGKGIGSALLTRAKDRNEMLNGWMIDHGNDKKLNGDSYLSPVNFYLKNDFKLISDTRLELEYLSCVKMRWQKRS